MMHPDITLIDPLDSMMQHSPVARFRVSQQRKSRIGLARTVNRLLFALPLLLIAAVAPRITRASDATVDADLYDIGDVGWDTGGANGLVQASDGNFYGTVHHGGDNALGCIFRLATNNVFTILYSFTGLDDGEYPNGLIQASDGNLYGTTQSGGASLNRGTVFRITTDGTFTTLHSFTGGDGGQPISGLLQGSDGNLYGTGTKSYTTTTYGGTVYRVTTKGALATLYWLLWNGEDGGQPSALIQAPDGNLYGATKIGGSGSSGTIFRVTTNGAFTTLYSFAGGNGGYAPRGVVLGSDGNLYGVSFGGANGYGTVFRISTSGEFHLLHILNAAVDGAYPTALAAARDGNVYGTTESGGDAGGGGTIFQVTTNGMFTTIYSFRYPLGHLFGAIDANPITLIRSRDGNLYGTTLYGGQYKEGTVFRINIPPPPVPLAIQSPTLSSAGLGFSIQTVAGASYTIQESTSLVPSGWTLYTNFTGDGSIAQFLIATSNGPARFLRVRQP